MKKVFKANLYFLIVMLGTMIVPIILAYIYRMIGLTDIRIILMLNHSILFLIPAVIYVMVTKCNIKETFRLNKLHIKDALLLVVIALVSYPLMGCFSAISILFFENEVATFIDSISSTPYIFLLLLVAVMPAITEEVTMRGVVLSGYNEKSKFKAALMGGILFGVFHLDAQQFLYAAALGFILSYVVRVTNSIFSSVLVHFLINGTSITLSTFLMKSSNYSEAVTEQFDLISLPFDTKLVIMCSYIMVIIVLGGLVFKLINVLERWNAERSGNVMGMKVHEEESSERIVNIPFIITIVIYILFMIIQSILLG